MYMGEILLTLRQTTINQSILKCFCDLIKSTTISFVEMEVHGNNSCKLEN